VNAKLKEEEYIKEPESIDVSKLNRNELILKYMPLVKIIAKKAMRKLPSSISYEDIESVGYIGLIDACEKFDPEKTTNFNSYAHFRIHGAIQDELRKMDYLSRTSRATVKKVAKTKQLLEKEGFSDITNSMVAEKMGLSLNDFYKNIAVSDVKVSRMEDLVNNESQKTIDINNVGADLSLSTTTPERLSIEKEMINKLFSILEDMPERQKLVLSLYYMNSFSLKEISKFFGVTDCRISQLHASAVQKMRALMVEMVQKDKI
jgi:RNA polymerase sigma factor for flagellar operon FliA